MVPKVQRYIRGQEEHHSRISFKDELITLLRRHRIPYDERYLLTESGLIGLPRGSAIGKGFDAALVSLDLAVLLWKQGRTDELKEIAAEMMTAFESREVHREALAALALFQRAARRSESRRI